MSALKIEFTTQFDAAGYEILGDRILPRGGNLMALQPLEIRTILFADFAKLESAESFAQFMGYFGPITSPTGSTQHANGELITDLEARSAWMRRAIDLAKSNLQEFMTLIPRGPNRSADGGTPPGSVLHKFSVNYLKRAREKGIEARVGSPAEGLKGLQKEYSDPEELAEAEIDWKQHNIYPIGKLRMTLRRGTPVIKHRSNGRRAQISEGRPILTVEPESLWDAMLYQFYEAIASGTNFRICEWCGDQFGIGGNAGRRRDARFCSDACRNRSHLQKRKDQPNE